MGRRSLAPDQARRAARWTRNAALRRDDEPGLVPRSVPGQQPAEAWAAHRKATPRSLNAPLRPEPRPRFPQPPVATPTPVPPALLRPRRLLAWGSMAVARGAGGARVSNAILRRLGETTSSAI